MLPRKVELPWVLVPLKKGRKPGTLLSLRKGKTLGGVTLPVGLIVCALNPLFQFHPKG